MTPHLESLITETLRKLDHWLAAFRAPVILWSGGKDSTVMLHLVHHVLRRRLPCIQWREPRFRRRYAYSDRLIADWDLEVHDYAPIRVALADGLDIHTGEVRFDFLKYYQIGNGTSLILSLGTEPPAPDQPFLCGKDDCLSRPLGTFAFPWDLMLHGQKSADVDLIKAEVPLPQDIRFIENAPAQAFPIRDWTDDDIWAYFNAFKIPIDTERYCINPATEKWDHSPDKSLNADYYPICFNCVNRHLGPSVHCPKWKCQTNNISHLAPYEDIVMPEQGFRPAWPAPTAQ